MKVLVTGGAGFIGRHLVDALVQAEHTVVVLDSLDPQAHPARPQELQSDVTYHWEDVRNRDAVREAAEGVEAVFHLASLIEVAQGEREVGKYVDVNVRGTAVLLDTLLHEVPSLRRIILTSSVAVYGEGAYTCTDHGAVEVSGRQPGQLEAKEWEVACPHCGQEVDSRATSEDKTPRPISVYGLTKLVQERLFSAASLESGTPAIILRFGNVYGPGQRAGAYGGVTTTFLQRVTKGKSPVVHEDGEEVRDYVFVGDAVRAALLGLEAPVEGAWIGNIASGRPVTVRDLARDVGEVAGIELPPLVEGTYRVGDIRHLWLDVQRARETLGFEATTGLKEGLARMLPAELP